MKISKNTVAIVSYKIIINDKNGKLIENVDEQNPKQLIFGNNSIIPGLETNMAGLEVDDNFEFTLKPEQAFDIYRNELLILIPKTVFEVDGVLKEDVLFVGNEISMLDNAGNPILGRVLEITDDKVKMDFNHKLAGENIFVSGKVHKVRPVTDDDLVPAAGCGSGCGCDSEHDSTSDSCCSSGENDNHESHNHGGGNGGCCC